jgi:hypothetical protein
MRPFVGVSDFALVVAVEGTGSGVQYATENGSIDLRGCSNRTSVRKTGEDKVETYRTKTPS